MIDIKQNIPLNGEEIWNKINQEETCRLRIAEFPDNECEAYIYKASDLSLYMYAVFNNQVFLDTSPESVDDIIDFLLELVNNIMPDLTIPEYTEIEDFLFGIEELPFKDVVDAEDYDVLDDRYYDGFYDSYYNDCHRDYYGNYYGSYGYYDKYSPKEYEKPEPVDNTPGFLKTSMIFKEEN